MIQENKTAYEVIGNDDYKSHQQHQNYPETQKRINMSNEKAIINQFPVLLVDEDEVSEEEDHEKDVNYTSLPSTNDFPTSLSYSSDIDRVKYISSIRKSRPLPKIPDRVSSKEISPQNLTVVVNDNFKNQNRMSAQQIFELINSRSVSSGDDEEVDTSDDDDEPYGGMFATKTQIPSPTLSNKMTLQQYYSEFSGNYKMMTPVEEVEEEDQLFEAYVEEQYNNGTVTSKYLLDPTLHDSQLSNKTPSLLSGRTSPSNNDSAPSIDLQTTYAGDMQQNRHEEHISPQDDQDQQQKMDTADAISSLNATATDGYDYGSPLPQSEDVSLLTDVQKLSRISKALMTPMASSETVPTLATLHQKQQQTPPPVGNIDGRRISSPLSVASSSLTHDKDSIKTYRRMATKTHDRNTQFTYTKYLMQLVSSYASMNDLDDETKDVRNRLQEEAEYWIDKLAKSNFAGALYIKGLWHRHCCDRKMADLFVGSQYKKVNHAKAFKCFLQAAKYGSIEAHYKLAEYWMVRKEYKKSIANYEYAASKNHILSLYVRTSVSFLNRTIHNTDPCF